MSLLQPIAPYRDEGLHSTPSDQKPEAASQTFKVGAPLVWSSGYLAEAGTNPTEIFGVSLAAGHGFTYAGGPAVAVDEAIPPLNLCGFVPIGPGVIFAISVDKASGQGTSSAILAQASEGVTFGITKDSTTGYWYLDVDKTATYLVVRVVGFIDPPSTVNGRVQVKFLPAPDVQVT